MCQTNKNSKPLPFRSCLSCVCVWLCIHACIRVCVCVCPATGAGHTKTVRKHDHIPMTHSGSRLSSERSADALQLGGAQIDNKPHCAAKVAQYGAGLSSLLGPITHTFTLMMDPDHMSKASQWRRLERHTLGTAVQLCDTGGESERKGAITCPEKF